MWGRSIGHKVEVAHFLKEVKTGFSIIHAINCNDLEYYEKDCFYSNYEVGFYNGGLIPDMRTLRKSYMEKEAIVMCDYTEPFGGHHIFVTPRYILKQ